MTRAAVGRVEREAAARTQQDRRKLGHEWEIVDGIRREREREREMRTSPVKSCGIK